jgi:hypothetical protein
MYDKIIQMMESNKQTISFFARMDAFNRFLAKHDIYPHIYKKVPEEPVSFIWAISSQSPEIFSQQMGSISQFPNIIQSHDQFVFVADVERKNDVLEVLGNIKNYVDAKIIFVRRGALGDRPTLNWDIGMAYAKHNRVACVRDMCLFFQPWDFVRFTRMAPTYKTLTSVATVLGAVWSRFNDQWIYLSHPDYAPTPYLFSFVANKEDIESVGGFDRVLSRGFDHSGELDFLLRWKLAGNSFYITPEPTVLHPGIPAANMSIDEMRFHSAINRRYFMDRWGDEFISKLQPPYSLDMALIEVNDALTLGPLMHVKSEDPEMSISSFNDIFTFSKRPDSHFVVEEI